MKAVRRAVIDVGTNSIKLLLAEVHGREVTPIHEESKQTRLGQGFYDSHRLQSESIARTAEAVARFAQIAREQQATKIQVIATSAARDAVNRDELIDAVEQASGLTVEIISGEQEADWVFRGVMSDPALEREPLLLLDVGGGSSELIVGRSREKLFAESFPLGTVRMLDRGLHGDPPSEEELQNCRTSVGEFLRTKVQPKLLPALERAMRESSNRPARLIATGGTATILARMEAKLEVFDRAKIESTLLSSSRVQWHVRNVWSLPLEQRRTVIGLPKNRADVILTGAIIYESVLEVFGFQEMRVSTRGLRFAAVIDA
jgi:exopolyphosphatase / guanosine-5'-triphosphate,3'-diphosphate pyrophosphatase